MSYGDSWGTYKTPCPNCGGRVKYAFFGSDCRWNDASYSIECDDCGREFTKKEWAIIAAVELEEMNKEYWEREYKINPDYKFNPYHPIDGV